jgi:hypothetical protein
MRRERRSLAPKQIDGAWPRIDCATAAGGYTDCVKFYANRGSNAD